jgi:hypothetical protein
MTSAPPQVWLIQWPSPLIVNAVVLFRTSTPPPPHVSWTSAESVIDDSEASLTAARSAVSSPTVVADARVAMPRRPAAARDATVNPRKPRAASPERIESPTPNRIAEH